MEDRPVILGFKNKKKSSYIPIKYLVLKKEKRIVSAAGGVMAKLSVSLLLSYVLHVCTGLSFLPRLLFSSISNCKIL